MDLELIKMVGGGGGAVAVIVVVILFLRQWERMQDTLKNIATTFTSQIADSQQRFQDQLTELMAGATQSQKLYQAQIKTLIDDHMAVTRETVGAVKSLDATVRGVDATVRNVEATVRELQTVVRTLVVQDQHKQD
jgi:phage shock protein A